MTKKIIINATKNYGEKIQNAISSDNTAVDGIYYSLADITSSNVSRIENYSSEVRYLFREFPIYYLTNNNNYIEPFMTKDEGVTSSNNKICCMIENLIELNIENLKLPLTPKEYVKNKDRINESIISFYDNYYSNDSLILTPTFLINKSSSWEDVMLEDIIAFSNNYADDHKKKMVLSFIISGDLLSDLAFSSTIIDYHERYSAVNGVSITIINDDQQGNYSKNTYINLLSFLHELNNYEISVFVQYAGIKDLPLSILNIERYGVGWFSTYRGFDLNYKKISDRIIKGFGSKVRKVFLPEYLSEVPLDYFYALGEKEYKELLPIGLHNSDLINFPYLELFYWESFAQVLEYRDKTRSTDSSVLIEERATLFIEMIDRAIEKLRNLMSLLEEKGRYDDARKLENNNISSLNIFKEAINEFLKLLII